MPLRSRKKSHKRSRKRSTKKSTLRRRKHSHKEKYKIQQCVIIPDIITRRMINRAVGTDTSGDDDSDYARHLRIQAIKKEKKKENKKRHKVIQVKESSDSICSDFDNTCENREEEVEEIKEEIKEVANIPQIIQENIQQPPVYDNNDISHNTIYQDVQLPPPYTHD